MNLLQIVRVGNAIEDIVNTCDCTIPEIIDALTGIALSEEEAGLLLEYHRLDEEEWVSKYFKSGQPKACKPSWSDVPKKANYLAQDSNGYWYWYKVKPYRGEGIWVPQIVEGDEEVFGVIQKDNPNLNWKDTLEGRPN